MPKPPVDTVVQGIFQSDLIIKSAIIGALNEALANPDLLDYVFVSMPKDEITNQVYGINEVNQAKKWFQNTNIKILHDVQVTKAEWPCVSISLLDSVEAEFTLGDIHYQPYEGAFDDFPLIINKFKPTSYSPSTGMMRIPSSALGDVVLDGAMVVIDNNGKDHPVVEVLDTDLISLIPGTIADFSNCMIRDANPGLSTPIESINNKETYQLTLAVPGEPIHLIYLHSILTFMLNRRKQDLLEARGFERSTMSSGKVERFQPTENETVYTRTINIVGFCRQTWVKDNKQVIQGVNTTLTVGDDGSGPPGLNDDGQDPTDSDLWTVDADIMI